MRRTLISLTLTAIAAVTAFAQFTPPGSSMGTSVNSTSPQRNGQPNTGFYSPSSGCVAVAAVGSQVVLVCANGYVGIGTSTPAAVLDVNGQIDLMGVQGISFPTVDTTANATVLIGSGAGTSLPASAAYGNIAIGYQALGGIALTTGAVSNTAIGYQAGLAITSGPNNTLVGYQCGLQLTTTSNTCIGASSLKAGNSASSVAIGANVLAAASITNGTGVGTNACSTCSGTGDTAVGANAGRFISSGARNVAVGQGAMQSITGTRVTGNDNTAVGDSSLLLCQGACAGNTVLGSAVGSTITTGTNNILIGNSATCAPGAITNSNEFHLCGPTADMMKVTGNGTGGTEVVTINGLTTLTTTGAGATQTLVNSAGTCTHTPGSSSETVSCSSDIKFKEHIRDADWGLIWVWGFHIRQFDIKATHQHVEAGVVAQELQKTHPEMVHVNQTADGSSFLSVDQPNGWKLIKAVQQLQIIVCVLFAMVIGSFGFTFYRTRKVIA